MMKDYVVVTAISMYRMRYVMNKGELEVASPGIKTTLTDNITAFEVAKDVVTMNECEEFSQQHMGEYIVDTIEMAEDDVLDMFDRENTMFAQEWSKDEKIAFMKLRHLV
jgi:ribosome maturation factor RimP|tara:strand:- start:4780 stop:5106 length:327 start_codon:yes stop_codon:yes gene_type:complete